MEGSIEADVIVAAAAKSTGERTMVDITRRSGEITRGKLPGGNPAFLRGRNNYPVQIFVGAYVGYPSSRSLFFPQHSRSRSFSRARARSHFQQTGLVKIYIRITWNNNPSNNYLRI